MMQQRMHTIYEAQYGTITGLDMQGLYDAKLLESATIYVPAGAIAGAGNNTHTYTLTNGTVGTTP